MRLDDFISMLDQFGIHELYEFLGYDYEKHREHVQSQGVVDHSPIKQEFCEVLDWKKEPSDEIIRRFFNQINTYYAEKWAISSGDVSPTEFAHDCIRLILCRQGKKPDLRKSDIGFGVRKNVDTLDPLRTIHWIRGIAPRFLKDSIAHWSTAVDRCEKNDESAVYLSLALIAIHPFADGNGRLARIAYSWLRRRWELPSRWIQEGSDGEFYRTGAVHESTEHLMGRFVIDQCGGHNEVPYISGVRLTDADKIAAYECLRRNLSGHSNSPSVPVTSRPFVVLLKHLRDHGHFTQVSPRFHCLKPFLV